jgi:phenylpropionate dioxygenase-like ring-hydroxylating dioxygenase large terminal subunit
MPDSNLPEFPSVPDRVWSGDLTRVPYWVYRDKDLLKIEQERVFEGPVWNFLCLESEIANPGDWRATKIGQMPVVVVRDTDGSIAAFENRCAHRGALICLDDAGGAAQDFQCVYHAWRYDLRGNLKSVAFQRGVNGKGGMPADFRLADHGPRKLRTTTLCGLVFGTLSDDTPDIETFIGPDVLAQFKRVVADRQIEIIGRFVQVLPNNWKMYAENVRDSYHASLLHLFFATFKINRLSQGGGLIVSPNGGCSVSSTIAPTEANDKAYSGMRSVDDDYRLEDAGLIDVVDEHPDRIRQQIVTVFPNFVVQKTQNAMALRFFTPNGIDRTNLEWIYFGYADDTPEMRNRRLRHLNLGGPAGFVSM